MKTWNWQHHLHLLSARHIRHLEWLESAPVEWTDDGLRIGGQYVMFYAEAELMRRHAVLLTKSRTDCDILEVGGGLGVFAREVLAHGVRSYLAIEPQPEVAMWLREVLGPGTPQAPIDVWEGPWQAFVSEFPQCDGIMYDTWPPDGLADNDFAIFIDEVCLRCLREGGRFSFFSSGEISSTRAALLRARFKKIEMESFVLQNLPPTWTKATAECAVYFAEL